MHATLSAPLSVQWELTDWCNNFCFYCYNYWRRTCKRSSPNLTPSQIEQYELTLEEVLQNGVFHATLTGGEPLAVIDQLISMLEKAADKGLSLSLNSNLTLLTPERVISLKRLGIRNILVSFPAAEESVFDGITQRTGSFRQTVRGIERAVAAEFPVTANMVVTRRNYHLVTETAAFVRNLGVVGFTATRVSAPPCDDSFSTYHLTPDRIEQLFLLLIKLEKELKIRTGSLEPYPACGFQSTATRTKFGYRGCMAGKTTCTIGFDGNIRPCLHASESTGHIRDGLKSSWVGMSNWRDGSLIPDFCKKVCGEYPVHCSGGCRAEAKNIHGTLNAPAFSCTGKAPVHRKMAGHLPHVNSYTKVVLESRVRFRKENFGYIAFKSVSNWLALDTTLYETLTHTTGNDYYLDAERIAQKYGVGVEQACTTVSKLLKKGIVRLIP